MPIKVQTDGHDNPIIQQDPVFGVDYTVNINEIREREELHPINNNQPNQLLISFYKLVTFFVTFIVFVFIMLIVFGSVRYYDSLKQ